MVKLFVRDERGATVAQVALAWLLHKKHVTSVIIGAKNEQQLADNLAATSVELSSDDLKRLNNVSKLKPEYPGWMLERLLGLDLKLRQYREGRAFCDAVVARAGMTGLNTAFAGPEQLPTLAEIADAESWLSRVAA